MLSLSRLLKSTWLFFYILFPCFDTQNTQNGLECSNKEGRETLNQTLTVAWQSLTDVIDEYMDVLLLAEA